MATESRWEIRILGPLEVARRGGEPRRVPRAKERALLAALALEPGRVVPVDALVEQLWGETPPATAANALQVHVSNARKLFDDDGHAVVVREPTGYRLDADVDLLAFEAAARAAAAEVAAARYDRASTALRDALALWRGAPLEDVPVEGDLDLALLRIEDLRRSAQEDLAAAELALGRHRALVPELEQWAASEPLHEPFREQLMLALYRSGRQQDALELFRTTRELFLDTLGLEPSDALRELERAILNQDPSIGAAAEARPRVRRRLVIAAQSIVDVDPEADDEALLEQLAGQVEQVSELYREAGARVETHPQGVLALFGFPTIREDDPARAAAAALRARELHVRTGVAAGTAVAGDAAALRLSRPSRRALELASAADRGQVLVDAGVQARVWRGATMRPVEGGDAYELVDAAEAARPLSDAPLVGRDADLEWVCDVIAEAADGEGVAAFVVGEAGIGKTRLAEEARECVAPTARVLYGRCRDRVGDPYLPLREALGDLVPDLGADAPVAAADVAAAVARAAGTRHTVLLFDDVHWAEPAFLEVLSLLPEAVAGLPVAVVALSRPEGPSLPWRRLTLDALDAAQTRELIVGLGAAREVAERVAGAVHDRGGGNPLFVEQLFAFGEYDAVPPTLEALLQARLDLVPADERRTLEAAAVADADVEPELLRRLLPDATGVDDHLDALCRRRLLRRDDGILGFAHQLIRDVVYDSLPRRERRTLHERLGTLLEERGADAAVVGQHLAAAVAAGNGDASPELAARAAAKLETAGRSAYARADNASARALLERALPLVEGDRRAGLLAELGDVLREANEYEAAFAAYDEADAATADEAFRARVDIQRMRLENSSRRTIDHDAHRRRLDEATEALERAGDDRSLAEAWLLRSRMEWFQCRGNRSEAAALRALAYARAAGERRTLGARRIENQCLFQQLGALVFGPTPVDRAVMQAEAIADLARGERVRLGAGRALAYLRAMQCCFDEARALLAATAELSVQAGSRSLDAGHYEIGARIELLADRPAEAAALLREAIALLEPVGETAVLPTFYALLAESLRRQGAADEARAAVEHAAQGASAEDRDTQVQWRTVAARLGGDDAERLAREAVELAEPTDFPTLRGAAFLALAEAVPAEAETAVEAARREFEAKGNLAVLARFSAR